MQRLTIILTLFLGLLSCNKTERPVTDKTLMEEQQKAKLAKLTLGFTIPVVIDSSPYVMYPLILENKVESEGSYESSSYKPTYWNIVFYNTANGEYHLLDNELKMVINSYGTGTNNHEALSSSLGFDEHFESGYNQVDRLLYYSIITNDFNKDGKLNSADPNYLFISDKAGKHFKQISPDNLNVSSWKTIKETNKILLMVTKDSNDDKLFNNKDETLPLVYDLSKNTSSTEIFTEEFKTKLKQQLDDQWTKEK